MTEFVVGQKIYGKEYDLLPIGTEFKQDETLTSSWVVIDKGVFRYSGAERMVGNEWRAIDYEYERFITCLPESASTIYIEHTLVGAKVGDKVWPVNMPPSPSKWPATIQGLDVDLVNVITADGHLERIHPSSLITTPIEPPVWSLVTTKTPATTASTFVHTDSGWRSLNGEWRTWPEICALDANGSPSLRVPE